MIQHGTDWNRHRGVGATLLENWVEERAVGDLIIQEREDIKKLSRNGHQNILAQSKDQMPSQSIQKEAHEKTAILNATSKVSLGKRRQLLEAELLKQALSDVDQPLLPASNEAEWVSTTKHDFAHTDFYPPIRKLGEKLPDEALLKKFEHPITFWSDHAVKGSGTVICSTDAAQLHSANSHHLNKESAPHPLGHRAGQMHQQSASAAPVFFGKHPGFTFPNIGNVE